MKLFPALACAAALSAFAQAPVVPRTDMTPLPIVDPAKKLQGSALLQALRGGGYVLYLRHARQAGKQDQAPCDRSNLAPSGVEQARKAGAALHEFKIPIGLVRASKWCRAIETARIIDEGEVQPNADLNIAAGESPLHAARYKLLAETPPPGTNTLVVAHGQGSPNREELLELDFCEIIVFRPDGKGHTEAVARIKLEDWDALR